MHASAMWWLRLYGHTSTRYTLRGSGVFLSHWRSKVIGSGETAGSRIMVGQLYIVLAPHGEVPAPHSGMYYVAIDTSPMSPKSTTTSQ